MITPLVDYTLMIIRQISDASGAQNSRHDGDLYPRGAQADKDGAREHSSAGVDKPGAG